MKFDAQIPSCYAKDATVKKGEEMRRHFAGEDAQCGSEHVE